MLAVLLNSKKHEKSGEWALQGVTLSSMGKMLDALNMRSSLNFKNFKN